MVMKNYVCRIIEYDKSPKITVSRLREWRAWDESGIFLFRPLPKLVFL